MPEFANGTHLIDSHSNEGAAEGVCTTNAACSTHTVERQGEPMTHNRNTPDTTGDKIEPAKAVKVGVSAGLLVVGVVLGFILDEPIKNNIGIFKDVPDLVVRDVFFIVWAFVVFWPIAYSIDRAVKRRAARALRKEQT